MDEVGDGENDAELLPGEGTLEGNGVYQLEAVAEPDVGLMDVTDEDELEDAGGRRRAGGAQRGIGSWRRLRMPCKRPKETS